MRQVVPTYFCKMLIWQLIFFLSKHYIFDKIESSSQLKEMRIPEKFFYLSLLTHTQRSFRAEQGRHRISVYRVKSAHVFSLQPILACSTYDNLRKYIICFDIIFLYQHENMQITESTHRAWALLGTRDDALLDPLCKQKCNFQKYCTYGSENICLKNFYSNATKLTLMFYGFFKNREKIFIAHSRSSRMQVNNCTCNTRYTECV